MVTVKVARPFRCAAQPRDHITWADSAFQESVESRTSAWPLLECRSG